MTPSSGLPRRGGALLCVLAAAAAVLQVPALAQAATETATTAPSGAPQGACGYLTRTMAQQPGAAVFLASYPAAESGPLRHVAFLYDNALAAMALLACGQAGQARRIGDAMLLGLKHDRHWHDGRLRNGYAAGFVDDSPLKLAGWWDAGSSRWLEDDYQAGSDSGNMAWAMLALLALDAGQGGRYADGAMTLAVWLEGQRDARGAGGFTGGSFGSQTAARRLLWKSTEHNVDLAAAFARLAAARGDRRWQASAQAAAQFVAAMWDPQRGAFAAGTGNDGLTRNALLALDAQIWPLLALPGGAPRYAEVLGRSAQSLRAGQGYAYSEAGGGAWTEGTAQMLLLFKLLHGKGLADPESAVAAARAPDGGYYAATVAALPTGFMLDTDPSKPRVYLHLEHLGATAWVALAEQGFNPFTGGRSLPP